MSIVKQDDYNKWLANQPKQFDENLINTFLIEQDKRPTHLKEAVNKLWEYPNEIGKYYENNMPPSLQQIDVQLIPNTFSDWG